MHKLKKKLLGGAGFLRNAVCYFALQSDRVKRGFEDLTCRLGHAILPSSPQC